MPQQDNQKSLTTHPLVSEGLQKTMKALLPAKNGRETKIVQRLTAAYDQLAKTTIPAGLLDELDDLYAGAGSLAQSFVFGMLGVLTELIEVRLTRAASNKGRVAGKALAPGLRAKFLGGRVNAYVNELSPSITERVLFFAFADAWARLAHSRPTLTYLRRLDQQLADDQKQARHMQFSYLNVAAVHIEGTLRRSAGK